MYRAALLALIPFSRREKLARRNIDLESKRFAAFYGIQIFGVSLPLPLSVVRVYMLWARSQLILFSLEY